MTSLQRKEIWDQTGRWDDEEVDVWFKSKLKNGTEVGFGWSHEEQITTMMKDFISSYRDMPAIVYQFQNKLRNELRAKSGIMRSREFLMKDMYSYSRTEEDHKQFYDKVIAAYLRIYDKVGLGSDTYLTFASGGAFTQFSHEFQTITDAGEDTIFLHRAKRLAINQEVMNEHVMNQLGVAREELEQVKASEVGNIFSFGTQKSQQVGLFFADEQGNSKPTVLGSYGIGVTRLMGVIVEHYADERGLVWPASVAPYQVYICSVGEDELVKQEAANLYNQLCAHGVEAIYDDRDVRPGDKFADCELMGIPKRLVVSAKTLAEGGYELKNRNQEQITIIKKESVIESLAGKLES